MNSEQTSAEDEEEETSITDLPLELFSEIGSHLSLKSFLNFKAASKSYYEMKELYNGRKYDKIQKQFDWLFWYETLNSAEMAKFSWIDALLANIVKKGAKVAVDLKTSNSPTSYFELLKAVIKRDGLGEINLGE